MSDDSNDKEGIIEGLTARIRTLEAKLAKLEPPPKDEEPKYGYRRVYNFTPMPSHWQPDSVDHVGKQVRPKVLLEHARTIMPQADDLLRGFVRNTSGLSDLDLYQGTIILQAFGADAAATPSHGSTRGAGFSVINGSRGSSYMIKALITRGDTKNHEAQCSMLAKAMYDAADLINLLRG